MQNSSITYPLYCIHCMSCSEWNIPGTGVRSAREPSRKPRRAFQKAKESLSQAPVLIHYDPELPLVLAADASPYKTGTVISHQLQDGSERPVAFASCTLMKGERNYAQVEKEALALIFGVKRFHQYLYGRRFLLITDHKLLTSILARKNGILPLAAVRMQHWALLLSAYTYDTQLSFEAPRCVPMLTHSRVFLSLIIYLRATLQTQLSSTWPNWTPFQSQLKT